MSISYYCKGGGEGEGEGKWGSVNVCNNMLLDDNQKDNIGELSEKIPCT